MKTDLHIHTWHSDGGCPPEQLFSLAKAAGIGCLAVTDHDRIADLDELRPFAAANGVRLLRGVELSAYDYRRNRRVHILGYLPEREAAGRLDAVRKICRKTCENRREAGLRMVELAAARYPITLADVERMAAHSDSIFKQHILLALMQAGFSSELYGALWRELFDSRDGSCLVEVVFPDVWTALPVLREAGAVCVLAHPYTYRSLELMGELADAGLLDGIEVWQSKTTPVQEAALAAFAAERGLLATGGSDYHGVTGVRPAPLGAGLTPDAALGRIESLLRERQSADGPPDKNWMDKDGMAMDAKELAVAKHREWRGKIEVISRAPITDRAELAVAYTPGVAEPCLAIARDPEQSWELTRRGNLVAVVTDGTAVLGLGDIGPEAAMPVMEGKCALFKKFAGVDAFPICLATKNVEELVRTVELLAPSFGGVNLEDIAAPRCFEIERRLQERLDIPVFHDDQHGTAIVVGAALLNSLKLAGKNPADVRVVINGAGAAGIAIAKLLLSLGAGDLILCDKDGILARGGAFANEAHREMAERTNRENRTGLLADAMRGADVFVGVSRPNLVTPEMVRSMRARPIIFAMANPAPEILPGDAKAAGAFIVGTGRSDFPNQINNVLAFPGIFKGALAARARRITEEMKLAAARAIAALAADRLAAEYILPDPFDPRVADAVAKAVSDSAGK